MTVIDNKTKKAVSSTFKLTFKNSNCNLKIIVQGCHSPHNFMPFLCNSVQCP